MPKFETIIGLKVLLVIKALEAEEVVFGKLGDTEQRDALGIWSGHPLMTAN